MKSIIYTHPKIYELVMRLLYGGQFRKRYEIIARECKNKNVLDLCCGDCYLANFINKENYTGIDINPTFIRHAKKRGINATLLDIEKDTIPRSDCIILQGSLYQFIPNEGKIIKKMLNRADEIVIISEPIHNLADIQFLNKITTLLVKTDKNEEYSARFNEERLRALFNDFGFNKTVKIKREMMGVFYAKK